MKKFWEKYKYLNIFVIITFFLLLIGLFNKYFEKISLLKKIFKENVISDFWDVVSILDSSTAIALAFLAFLAYKEYAKGEDEISLEFEVLDENLKSIETIPILSEREKITILRRNVNRGEVLGIMGMVQKKSTGRYDISNKVQKKFLDRILEIQKGKKDKLLIPIIKDDYDRYFNIEVKSEEKENK